MFLFPRRGCFPQERRKDNGKRSESHAGDMYSPGIPWHVLDVSTLAQPSQFLPHWLCALQQQDSLAGGWAQDRLSSAGGQVLPPELRKGHSLS